MSCSATSDFEVIRSVLEIPDVHELGKHVKIMSLLVG